MEISLEAEKIFYIGNFGVTNSILATWFGIIVLIILVFLTKKFIALVPQKIYNFVEMVIEFIYDLIYSVTTDYKKADILLPLLAAFFIFIVINNWLGILPGFGSLIIYEHGKAIPLLRSSNADLNTTLALALISVGITQYYAIQASGFFGYAKKFFDFSSPVNFFVGILELISEFAKIISFSFRLFGNVFAGEVLLLVITMLVPYLIPVPFYGLELFFGLIQALIFTMLTLVFIKLATSHH